ncbi:M16 family metallopeptidase, partial [Longimicrobium sp.]|uniref:M16 family metallopeptidase n=1 Tax=Longimicrobium sp. TaxID=2029185 RepID=UPI002F920B4C
MQRTILLSTAAAALALGLAAPAVAQTATAPRTVSITNPVPLTAETYRLPNGLNVVLSRDTSVPVVAVNLWYHVGSGNEVAGRTGFAHLFEHIMFQGSAHVPSGQHIGLLQAAGASVN